MRINNVFNNKNKSLVDLFGAIISISIFTTVLFMSVYYVYTSNVLIKQDEIDKNITYKALTNVIVENFHNDLDNNDYSSIKRLSQGLINNKLILYASITDKKTYRYEWSSIKELIGSKSVFFNPWKSNVFKQRFINISPDEIKEITTEYENYIISVGFYNKNSLAKLVNILIKGSIFLAFIFIIFGFASAFSLARFVTKPIKELALGAEEFSKGNLKYRASVNTQDEIGKLSQAFNDMAEKLDILYTSLEQKVIDRTNEISQKNEQLQKAYKELQEAQSMIVHNEKMSSLGQLVAGIAHELNNPINYIYGNLAHLKNYANDLIRIINTYETISSKFSDADMEEVNKLKEEIEYDFIVGDLAELLRSCREGSERCKQIILDLKNFSRIDEAIIKEVDIHEGINSTLNILHNKYKNKITVHKEYGTVPLLSCYAGQLNQVFMNILDNASQAIPDKGDVYIRTRFEENNIIIEFEDNGSGISKENLSKIFDPFFTTKPVGEGTGLGLSITYKVIKNHNGTITVESEKGKGTKFIISIPNDWNPGKDNVNDDESQKVN